MGPTINCISKPSLKGRKDDKSFCLKNELTFTPNELENKYILLEIEFKKGLDLSKEQGEVLKICHISKGTIIVFQTSIQSLYSSGIQS